jgi:hypothetical protein
LDNPSGDLVSPIGPPMTHGHSLMQAAYERPSQTLLPFRVPGRFIGPEQFHATRARGASVADGSYPSVGPSSRGRWQAPSSTFCLQLTAEGSALAVRSGIVPHLLTIGFSSSAMIGCRITESRGGVRTQDIAWHAWEISLCADSGGRRRGTRSRGSGLGVPVPLPACIA